MKRTLRAMAVLASGVVAASGLTLAGATSASAASSCPWPYVCFENSSGTPISMYKDYGWQTTGPLARSAHYVVNARNDDCALMHFSTGEYITLYPQNSWALSAPITEIDIENGCP